MSSAEALWSFTFLGLLLVAQGAFARYRRGTDDFKRLREFKQRLPARTKAFEAIALFALMGITGGLAFQAFTLFHKGRVEGATAVYAFIGTFLVAWPVSALSANGISWVVPSLSRANEAAMPGTGVSLSNVNRGIARLAAVMIPVGLLALCVAVLEPWAQ